MKKILIIILLLIVSLVVSAQTYEKSIKVDDLGKFERGVDAGNEIKITSYVTKKKISKNTKRNVIVDLLKFRYELVLTSNSIYRGRLAKTWMYGARVFIDSVEVSKQQFPEGFTAIIGTTPTTVYTYDTNLDTINIKITWRSSVYYRNR